MGHKAEKDSNTTAPEVKEYNLTFLDASQPIGDTTENDAEFVKDLETFKQSLPIFEIPKVELAQC